MAAEDASLPSYVIVSKPQSLLTLSTIRHLRHLTTAIYVAYPPSLVTLQQIKAAEKQLDIWGFDAEAMSKVHWCPFDPFGPKNEVRRNAQTCLKIMKKGFAASTPSSNEFQLDGVFFHSYGVIGDGKPSSLTGLLPLVEYKLIGNLIFLDVLLEHQVIAVGARVVFLSSEAARGLPKMGFPVPKLGSSVKSIQLSLTGASTISGHSTDGDYSWKQTYAEISAIAVLVMRRLSRKYDQFYFAAVSPGMTEESLNPESSPNASLVWRLQLFVYRHLFFGLLRRLEIAKTVDDGSLLLFRALHLHEWTHPSGSFVGALSGTGGPIGDQTALSGGAMFRDERLQDLAYDTVQPYVV